ncbi:MAG: VWA domain-containing protein [Thermodesulfobacteriota bacterium]
MTFAQPWALLALLLLPLIIYRRWRQPAKGGLPWSAGYEAAACGATLRQRTFVLPFALELLALALIIVALARPQLGLEKVEQIRHGIAIEMVVDRSSSMAEEFVYRGRKMSRLAAVKEAFGDFVLGQGDLSGRPSDLIGLVAFARFPETICPLTLAHGALAGFLPQLRLVDLREEDGTALGDGLALAAARLNRAAEDVSSSYQIKSKVIILFTDGRHNMGSNSPKAAAQLAREWGITIYAIGIGEPAGAGGIFSRLRGGGVDEKTLAELAETTGGRSWLASDGKALTAIYAEIDALEKSEITAMRYLDYQEYFPRFIVSALIFLLLARLGRWTLWSEVA